MWFTQDCGIHMAVNRNITNRKKMAYLNEEYQHFNYNPDTDWGHSELCLTGPTLSPECLESGLFGKCNVVKEVHPIVQGPGTIWKKF